MICHKCFAKIAGEGKAKLIDDHLEFYHAECFPDEVSIPVDERSMELIAKGVLGVLKQIPGEDVDTTGIEYKIKIQLVKTF